MVRSSREYFCYASRLYALRMTRRDAMLNRVQLEDENGQDLKS